MSQEFSGPPHDKPAPGTDPSIPQGPSAPQEEPPTEELDRVEVPQGESPEGAPHGPLDQTSLSFGIEETKTEEAPPVGVRLEVDAENIGWVVFDDPNEKVNRLGTAVMERLRALLDEALRRNVQGLVFVSDKENMFIAGADIEEIAHVETPQEGTEKAAWGQAVFEAISRFPRPTVAVLNGPCVGGGYELVLACRTILAENNPKTRIGLPEVKLGILPGFGGTQRLPKRVGIRTALDLILSGKTLPVKPALKRGMIDAVVPEGRGREIAKEVITKRRRIKKRPLSRIDKTLATVGPLRNFVLGKARDALAKKADRSHYPSPYMALEAIAASYTLPETEAYSKEARLLGEAIVTPTSKSLTWLFRVSSESKKPVGLGLDLARPVHRMAVVGAGIMGGGVAWLAGEKGFPIRIKDIRLEALEGALATAGKLWAGAVKRRRLTPAERDRRLEKLSYTLDYRGFRHIDFVEEAVIEDLEIKHQVISEIEREVTPETVIASNTSSLKIEDIAAGARRPERITGLHFFNPVDRMPLVEVIAGPQSSESAVATTYKLALKLGKTPILVGDCPGFLVNRLLAFYLGESLHLHEEGVPISRIDKLFKQFGMPMGPFALLDQIGLDVAEKVTKMVGDAYGDRLPTQTRVTSLVKQGKLGKKSGSGFYDYDSKGKPRPGKESVKRSASFNDHQILHRPLYAMVNEAARCLDEGVARRPLDIDLGMVMGTGFPPFRGGLLRWADSIGVDQIITELVDWSPTEDRFTPSRALEVRRSGFYEESASASIEDEELLSGDVSGGAPTGEV